MRGERLTVLQIDLLEEAAQTLGLACTRHGDRLTSQRLSGSYICVVDGGVEHHVDDRAEQGVVPVLQDRVAIQTGPLHLCTVGQRDRDGLEQNLRVGVQSVLVVRRLPCQDLQVTHTTGNRLCTRLELALGSHPAIVRTLVRATGSIEEGGRERLDLHTRTLHRLQLAQPLDPTLESLRRFTVSVLTTLASEGRVEHTTVLVTNVVLFHVLIESQDEVASLLQVLAPLLAGSRNAVAAGRATRVEVALVSDPRQLRHPIRVHHVELAHSLARRRRVLQDIDRHQVGFSVLTVVTQGSKELHETVGRPILGLAHSHDLSAETLPPERLQCLVRVLVRQELVETLRESSVRRPEHSHRIGRGHVYQATGQASIQVKESVDDPWRQLAPVLQSASVQSRGEAVCGLVEVR